MIADLLAREWDAVVIGTGIGGGTVGRRLAERGLSVLFLERGPAGRRAERQGLDQGVEDPTARRIRGYWPSRVATRIGGRGAEVFAPLGAGLGGSSVFYAASLERPEPHDLEDRPGRPHPTGGWPVSYAEMAPHLAEAERLYGVTGSPDPRAEAPGILGAPPPMGAADAALFDALVARGLAPYRAHLAIRYLPGCDECLGRKCPRPCKMDGRSAGVEPALATGRAALLDGVRVTRIRAEGGRVTGLAAVRAGAPLEIRARRVVLSAGALASPALLLASASEAWPDGLANRSGLVGRNLMCHLNEIFALWPPGRGLGRAAFAGPQKAIALRDFYHAEGARFGLVQAMGLTASYGNILQFLTERFDRSALARIRALRAGLRLPALAASRIFGDARIYVGLLEDLPYADNRVRPAEDGGDRLRIDYAFAPELLARRRAFRRAIARGMRGLRLVYLNREPDLNLGHPCGTLRFGSDPARAVLDRDCRAHGLANLWVADAAFMPTSTGVNPSLTIAANALRVAEAIAADRGAGRAAAE